MLHRKLEAPASGRAYSELRRLSWREREVADIVGRYGVVTAVDLQKILRDVVSNATVRSTLNRLVEKRVLMRLEGGFGAFLYAPAQTESSLRDSTLERFACDFHDGSLEQLAAMLAGVWATARTVESPTGRGHSSDAWRVHRGAVQAKALKQGRARSSNEALERCAADFYAGSLEQLAEFLSRHSSAAATRKSFVAQRVERRTIAEPA